MEVVFCGLPLDVAPGAVMTPRRATEALVHAAVARVGRRQVRVADVGTGSGAIALALAAALPRAQVFATDTSAAAVALTRRNVRRLGLADRVTVHCGDLLAEVAGSLDLVVANLPYLPAAEAAVHGELGDEPPAAVFAPGDGLGPYRRLISAARDRVRPDGSLVIQLRRRVLAVSHKHLDGLATALDPVALRAG